MAITRGSIIKSPALVNLQTATGNTTFYTKEDIQTKLERRQFEIKSSGFGLLEKRDQDVAIMVPFTPDGQWNANIISTLWPYNNTTRGTVIYPLTTDYTAAFHCANGNLFTVKSYAITKMPPIKFSAIQTLIGQGEITGIRASNAGAVQEWSATNSLFTSATTGSTFTDTGFAPVNIRTQPYFLTLATPTTGGNGWTTYTDWVAIESEDGFDFSTELKLTDDVVNSTGILDKRYDDCQVMLKFKPIGPTAADLISSLSMQGATPVSGVNSQRGQSNTALSSKLTIVGADGITYLTIPNATLIDGGFGFGATLLQNGEIGFIGSRSFTSGAQNALFTLAAS